MRLIWSPQARADLYRIAGTIASDKKEAARRWAQEVEKKVSRLSRFPQSGRMVPEVRRPEIREVIVGSYRVIYKIGNPLGILTIFHGSKGSLPDLQKFSAHS